MNGAGHLDASVVSVRRSVVVLALVGLLTASAARAERWWIINGAHDRIVIAAETDSMRVEDGVRLIWAHWFYPESNEHGEASALIQFAVRCRPRRLGERRYTDFAQDGREMGYGDNSKLGLMEVEPGTSSDALIDFACASKQKRSRDYLAVDADQDYQAVAKAFLQGRPSAFVPST